MESSIQKFVLISFIFHVFLGRYFWKKEGLVKSTLMFRPAPIELAVATGRTTEFRSATTTMEGPEVRRKAQVKSSQAPISYKAISFDDIGVTPPGYPDELIERGVSGTVKICLQVKNRAIEKSVFESSGYRELDDLVMHSLRPLESGKNIESILDQNVMYVLTYEFLIQ